MFSAADFLPTIDLDPGLEVVEVVAARLLVDDFGADLTTVDPTLEVDESFFSCNLSSMYGMSDKVMAAWQRCSFCPLTRAGLGRGLGLP